MKISKDIKLAKKDYPGMYHVISSNEVHSFETRAESKKDFLHEFDVAFEAKTGFWPTFVPPPIKNIYAKD